MYRQHKVAGAIPFHIYTDKIRLATNALMMMYMPLP